MSHNQALAVLLRLVVPVALLLAPCQLFGQGPHEPIRGKIVQINRDSKIVTIKTSEGQTVELSVTGRSAFELNGEPTRLDQFRVGQRVRIQVVTSEGRRQIIRMWGSVGSEEELARKARETLQAARSYGFQKKEEYEGKLRGVLNDLDDRLDDLRDRAAEATADAKERLAPEIERLKEKRDALAKRLDQVQSASQDAWEDVKAGVAAAADDLRDTWDRIRARFKDK